MTEEIPDWMPRDDIVSHHSPRRYCNDVLIFSSPYDFSFDFYQQVATPGENNEPVVSPYLLERIIMSPLQAKDFLARLKQTLDTWQQQFGELPTFSKDAET